jgi:hypothetical protein
MLKKSLFSPAQPRRAETRLFLCIRSRIIQILNVPLPGKDLFRQLEVGRVEMLRLRSSLAAALLNGLFEHPARGLLLLSRCIDS